MYPTIGPYYECTFPEAQMNMCHAAFQNLVNYNKFTMYYGTFNYCTLLETAVSLLTQAMVNKGSFIVTFVSLFNNIFDMIYYDHILPHSKFLIILPTSLPIQLHVLSVSLPLKKLKLKIKTN